MYSVKVPRQTEAQAGWEWHPSQMPAKRSVLSRSGLSRSSAAGITLLAAGWFAWPADAARQWDAARYLSPAHEMFGWNGARNTHTSPQAVLIEFAQREGTDGAVVPPVKRQAPQMPATQPEAPAPAPVQESPPAPAADAPKPEVRQPSAQQAQPSAETAPAGSWFDALTARMTEWLAKANREYQGTIVKELSKPGSQDADAARLAAEKAAQEQAAREQAERARAEQEQARQAAAVEETRKRAEADARRNAAEAAKDAEARKQAEAAAQQKAAEQQEQPETSAQPDKAAQEAEAEKLREASRIGEEHRAQKLKDEQTRREQAEAERKAREARLEQERKNKALADAEAKLKAAEAARVRKEAEAARTAESAPEPVLRHRKWSVTIIPEPISRPEARERDADGGVLAGARQMNGRMGLGAGSVRGGPAVKRWVMRQTSCRYAGQKRKRRYVVARGDSLWRISEKYYDNGAKYPRIYKANRDRIADPDLIYPCQRFRVPKR